MSPSTLNKPILFSKPLEAVKLSSAVFAVGIEAAEAVLADPSDGSALLGVADLCWLWTIGKPKEAAVAATD